MSSSKNFGKLLIIAKQELSVDLRLGRTKIGFDIDADVRLLTKGGKDLHCTIDIDESGVATITSNSQKLSINGVPYNKPCVLKHLDMILLGDTNVKVQYINENQKNIPAIPSRIPRIKRKSMDVIQHHTPLKSKTPAKKAAQPAPSTSSAKTPRVGRVPTTMREKSKTTSKLNSYVTPIKKNGKRLSLNNPRTNKPTVNISSRNVLLSNKNISAGKFGQSTPAFSRKAVCVTKSQQKVAIKESVGNLIKFSPSTPVLESKSLSTFSSSSTNLKFPTDSFSVSPIDSTNSSEQQKTSELDVCEVTPRRKSTRNQKCVSGDFAVDLERTVTPSATNMPTGTTDETSKGLNLELYKDSEEDETLKENVSSNLRKRSRESIGNPSNAKRRRLEKSNESSRTFHSFSTDTVLSELNPFTSIQSNVNIENLIEKPIINDPQVKKDGNGAGIKKSTSTPSVHMKPKNHLSNVHGVKRLLRTPKIQKSPKNDLTNVSGLKNLMKTPRVQKTPKNDLSDLSGVESLLSTPRFQKSPKNGVGNVNSLKKSVRTPKVTKSPKNHLFGLSGVKKLLSTPDAQKSATKKSVRTPGVQETPKNDSCNFGDVENLFSTPNIEKSPKSSSFTGLEKLKKTPRVLKTPKNDLSAVGSVEKLVSTPNTQKSATKKSVRTPRVQETPKNDSCNFGDVENLFSTPNIEKSPKSSSFTRLEKLKKTPRVLKTPKNHLSVVDSVENLVSTPNTKKSATKKSVRTPRVQETPKNDSCNFGDVENLFSTPNIEKSPKSSSFTRLKKLKKTPRVLKTPKNNLSAGGSVENLVSTPNTKKSATKKSVRTPRVQETPKNDSCNFGDVENLFSTPNIEKSPKCSSFTRLEKLKKTPRVLKTPKNDLSAVGSVENLVSTPNTQKSATKKSVRTPRVQETPKNDSCNFGDVENLFSTPNIEKSPKCSSFTRLEKLKKTPRVLKTPKNDLSAVGSVENLVSTPNTQKSATKKSVRTPRVQETPKNDSCNFGDGENLFSTPNIEKSPKSSSFTRLEKLKKTPRVLKTPKNDLSVVGSVENLVSTPNTQKSATKKSVRTPRVQETPKNDSCNFGDGENLFSTPNIEKSPKSSSFTGLEKLKKTPIVLKTPKNHLSPVGSVENLVSTPNVQKSAMKKSVQIPRVQKAPKNDLSDVDGVEKLFNIPNAEKSPKDNKVTDSYVHNLLTSKVEGTPKKLTNTPKMSRTPQNDLCAGTAAAMTRSMLRNQETPKINLSRITVGSKEIIKTPTVQRTFKNSPIVSAGTKKLTITPKQHITPSKVIQTLAVQETTTIDNSVNSEQPKTTPRSLKVDVYDITTVIQKIMTPKLKVTPENYFTAMEQFMNTSNAHESPKGDSSSTTKKSLRTHRIQKSPKNDLTNIVGVKKLLTIPKLRKSPRNDLTNVAGVKKLMTTPKSQKSPRNDLTNVAGVKKLLTTPKLRKAPRNDLTNVAGVKILMTTPKSQKSPRNDLTNVAGVKKLMSSPKVSKSPKNDLTNVAGVKKLMSTPKVQNSPRNDLSNVTGVEQLMSTPNVHSSSKKDFSDLSNIKGSISTPTVPKLFQYELNMSGVKQLMGTPTTHESSTNPITDDADKQKSQRTSVTRKSPKNKLSNLTSSQHSMSIINTQETTESISSVEDLVVSVDSSSIISSSGSSQDKLSTYSGLKVTSTPIARTLRRNHSSNSNSEQSEVGDLTTNRSPIQTINDAVEDNAVMEDTIISSKSETELEQKEDEDEDLFAKLFHKKPRKVYRGKSMSPTKAIPLHRSPTRKTFGDVPDVNPRVHQWIEEHEMLMRDQKDVEPIESSLVHIDNVETQETTPVPEQLTSHTEVTISEAGVGRNTRRRAKQDETVVKNEETDKSSGGKIGKTKKVTRQSDEPESNTHGTMIPAEVEGSSFTPKLSSNSTIVTRQHRDGSVNYQNGSQIQEKYIEIHSKDDASISVEARVTRNTRQRSRQQSETPVQGKETEESSLLKEKNIVPAAPNKRVTRKRQVKEPVPNTKDMSTSEGVRATRQRKTRKPSEAESVEQEKEKSISVLTETTENKRVTRRGKIEQPVEASTAKPKDTLPLVESEIIKTTIKRGKSEEKENNSQEELVLAEKKTTETRKVTRLGKAEVQTEDATTTVSSAFLETEASKPSRKRKGTKENNSEHPENDPEENLPDLTEKRTTETRKLTRRGKAEEQTEDATTTVSSASLETEASKPSRKRKGTKQNNSEDPENDPEENLPDLTEKKATEKRKLTRRGKAGEQTEDATTTVSSASLETEASKPSRKRKGTKQNNSEDPENVSEENLPDLTEKRKLTRRGKAGEQTEDATATISSASLETEASKTSRQCNGSKRNKSEDPENDPEENFPVMTENKTTETRKLTRRGKAKGQTEDATAMVSPSSLGTEASKTSRQRKGTKRNKSEYTENDPEEKHPVLTEKKTTETRKVTRRGKAEEQTEDATATVSSASQETRASKPSRQRKGRKQNKLEDKENYPEENHSALTESEIRKTSEKTKVAHVKGEEEAKVPITKTATQPRKGKRAEAEEDDSEHMTISNEKSDNEGRASLEHQIQRVTRLRVRQIAEEVKQSPISTRRKKENETSVQQSVKHVHWDEDDQNTDVRPQRKRTRGTT